MKNYTVRIPLVASVFVEVKAENESEAIKKAIEDCDLNIVSKSEIGYELDQWDIHDKICEGNFYYAHINEADAEELD